MSAQTTKQQTQLEDSKLWQLSKKIADETRQAVKLVPYSEFYVFASPAIERSVRMSSNIAGIIGMSGAGSASNYRMVRGDLFTLKGLILMAGELDFLQDTTTLMQDIKRMQSMLEKEITAAEKTEAQAGAVTS